MLPIAFLLLNFTLPGAGAAFDAKALEVALTRSEREKSNVLIYTWSPRMSLSLRGAEELLKDKKRAYRVLFLLEDRADRALAEKVVKEKSWPRAFMEENRAPALRARGAEAHFPSYQFVKNGKFAGPLQPGYRTPAELKALAEENLK